MDVEITKAISGLGSRISNQEILHKDIDVKSHGVVSKLPAIILAVLLSALISYRYVSSQQNFLNSKI